MPYVKAQLSVPQIEDANGNPASGYTISSYLWDTSTPTPMYTSSAGAGSATSFTLNSLGQPQSAGGTAVDIFLDTDITYKFIVRDAGNQPVGPTIGPINASDGTASTITFLQSGTGAVEREANAKMAEQFTLTDFGGVPDNSDNTLALVKFVAAIRAVGSNVVAVIPPGRYKFKPASHYSVANAWREAIELVDVVNVEISAYGAVLVQDVPLSWTVGDAANFGNDEGPIQFRSSGNGTCSHITIKGLTVEMIKLAYSGGVGDGHAYGVALRGVKNYKVQDVNVSNSATDGIYIGPTYGNTYSGSKGKVIDCECATANRNCLSVVQNDDVKIIGGTYESASGGSFQSGIDLEPDIGKNQSNIKVIGATIRNNTGRGITGIRTSNLVITACDIYNNGKDVSFEGSCSRVLVTKNNITTNMTAGLGVEITGNNNTDIGVTKNTIHMPGVPNLHVRVGFGGSTGMKNVRVNDNDFVGEGGIDVRNVSEICEVNGNSHFVTLLGGTLADTNLFIWYIEPVTARVHRNNIRIDTTITWAGIQNKFQIVAGYAEGNKFSSHSNAVCNMFSRTTAFPAEYGENEWSDYFYYDENLASDNFRIKRKGCGIKYEGSVIYQSRVVTGGFGRTTNINAVDNQVGDIAYNYATTAGNPIAYRCTVAGVAGVSAGTWVGLYNKT